ncbi:UNVERIFIED_CONTAM: hypothetical protein HDU68_010853 [Siphonaria sp. JEL0065]|nr:hypothetical protein HDU68_010853 [Siphonaria sp. JEL0065]
MFSALSKALDRRSLPSVTDLAAISSSGNGHEEDDEIVGMMKEYMVLQKQQLALEKEKFEKTLAFEKEKFSQEIDLRRQELEFRKAELEWRKHVDQSLLDLKQSGFGGIGGGNELVNLVRDGSQVQAPTVAQITNDPHREEAPVVISTTNEVVPSFVIPSKPKKIFISYCWKNSRAQKTLDAQARKIQYNEVEKAGVWDPRSQTYELIKQLGYEPWLDVDQLKVGNGLEGSLADVLSDDVSLVIVHASDEYAASVNCRKEFEFATSLDLKIIPLIIGETPKAAADQNQKSSVKPWQKGWLGFQIAHTLYVDVRNPNELQSNMQRVADVIGKTMKEILPNEVTKTSDGYKTIREAIRAKDDVAVIEMLKSTQETLNLAEDGTSELDSILDIAVQNIGLDTIKALVAHGVKINDVDSTPVIMAVKRESKEILLFLLEHGADVNAVDSNQSTALHVSASLGSVEMCEILLHHDARIEEVNSFGYTPLLAAVSSVKLETTTLLLEHGANQFAVDTHSEGNAINIIVACSENAVIEFEIFQALLQAKTPINVIDDQGHTVLETAVFGGKFDVVMTFAKLENSKELFSDDNYALIAASEGHIEILMFLTGSESPVKYNLAEKNSGGFTALSAAISLGHLEVVKYLVNLDPQLLGAKNSNDSLMMLAASGFQWSILDFLVFESGFPFDLKETDSDEYSVLAHLATSDEVDLFKKIKDREPSLLGPKTQDYNNLLRIAVDNGNLSMIKYLLTPELKCYFNLKDENQDGSTVLVGAIASGNLEAIHLLLDLDSSLLYIDVDAMMNPLHYATSFNQFDILKFLMNRPECDFDLQAIDTEGNTLFSNAITNNNVDMAAFLLYKDASLINIRKNDVNILLQAAENGSWDSVKFLLSRHSLIQFDLSEVSNGGNNIALLVASTSRVDILETLAGIDISLFNAVNNEGENVLIRACLACELETVKFLLNHSDLKIDVEYSANDGYNAMLAAASCGSLEIVKMLYERNSSLLNTTLTNGEEILSIVLRNPDPIDLLKFVTTSSTQNLSFVDTDGWTPLASAVLLSHLESTKYLMSLDVSQASFRSMSGQTLLHLAATNDNLAIIKFLVSTQKFDLHALDMNGQTAFSVAVSWGHTTIVKYLLSVDSTQVQIGPSSYSNTLLHVASSKNLAICKIVLDSNKSDLHAVNDFGRTPLAEAICSYDFNIAKYFISVDSSQLSISANADLVNVVVASGDNVDILKALLDTHKFDLCRVNSNGDTPFAQAIRSGHYKSAKLLLSIDPTVANFHHSSTDKSLAQIAIENGDNLDCLKLVLEYARNIDLCHVDADGNTALSLAICNQFENCVAHLIGLNRLQLSFQSDKNESLLHLAVSWDKIDILKLLQTVGEFDLHQLNDDGESVLSLAVARNSIKCISYLINLDATLLDFKTPTGRSLLHIAADSCDNVAVVDHLLATGRFDLAAVDDEGATPLALAVSKGYLGQVRHLVAFSGKPDASILSVKDRTDKRNLVHLVVQSSDNLRLLKLILGLGTFDLHQVDSTGYSPLALAISGNQKNCANHLTTLDHSQLAFVFAPKKQTLLQLAVECIWDGLGFIKNLCNLVTFDLHNIDSDGNNVLSTAIKKEDVGVVKFLAQLDPTLLDPEFILSSTNQTLIHLGVSNTLVLEFLLSTSVKWNLNVIDSDGYSPLALAVSRGSLEAAKLLISLDSEQLSFKLVSNNQSLLHLTAWNDNVELLKLLVASDKVDLKHQDSNGHTVLSLAVSSYRSTKCVKYLIGLDLSLLEFKSPLNESLLHLAPACSTGFDILRILSCAGKFDYLQTNSDGYTAFGVAVQQGEFECARLLFAQDPSVISVSNGTDGFSLARIAVEAVSESVPFLKFLLGLEKYNLHQVYSDGHTLLSAAVQSGKIGMAKYLYALEPTLVNFKLDAGNKTLAQIAVANYAFDALEFVVETSEVDLHNVDDEGMTCFSSAVESGFTDHVRYLARIDPTLLEFAPVNESKRNLVQLAFSSGERTDILNILLSSNVKFDLTNIDSDGHTALSYALNNGYKSCAKRLISHDPSLLTFSLKSTNQNAIHFAVASDENRQLLTEILKVNVCNLHQVDSYGETPLAAAIRMGTYQCAKLLIEQDTSVVDFLIASPPNTTLLHYAAANTDTLKIYKLLIQAKKFDLHQVGGEKLLTPFGICILNGYLDAAKYLLSLDITQLACKSEANSSLLHLSADQPESLKFLLSDPHKSQFDTKATNDWGNSLLSLAIEESQIESVKFLVELDRSLLTASPIPNELSVLEWASWLGNDEIFDFVFEKWDKATFGGGDEDAFLSFLCYAAYSTQDSLIDKALSVNESYRKLVEAVAVVPDFEEHQKLFSVISVIHDQVNSKSPLPRTEKALGFGFAIAAYNKTLDLIKILDHFSAKFDSTIEFYGESALNYAAVDSSEAVSCLLNLDKSNLVGRSYVGKTVFYTACAEGELSCASLLLEAGTDPNSPLTRSSERERIGFTALHAACFNKRVEAIKYLLSIDAVDVAAKDCEGSTPLHVLATVGFNEDTLKEAVNEDAENDDEDEVNGLTDAEEGTEGKETKEVKEDLAETRDETLDLATLVKQFVEKGADINSTDLYGRTPLDVARSAIGAIDGKSDFANALMANGAIAHSA